MKNKLADLNNHLFAQLERLGEEDLNDEQIEREAKRADAIVSIANENYRTRRIPPFMRLCVSLAQQDVAITGLHSGSLPMPDGAPQPRRASKSPP